MQMFIDLDKYCLISEYALQYILIFKTLLLKSSYILATFLMFLSTFAQQMTKFLRPRISVHCGEMFTHFNFITFVLVEVCFYEYMLYFAIPSANFAQLKDSTTPVSEHQIILLSITITSATRLRFHPCWFVSRITEVLPNGFPQNLDGSWVLAQNRPH